MLMKLFGQEYAMLKAAKADYDKFAEEFSKTRSAPWKEVSDFLEELPKSAKIIDIGCGNGRHLIEAKKRGLNVIGVDISRNLLKIAKKKTGAPLVLGNALALPFKESAFDNSMCIAVVHHFKTESERASCLKEIAHITQNSSLVSVWAFEQEKFANRKSPDIQLGWNNEHPRFYHLFREGELEELIGRAGLKPEKVWRSANNYWAVVEHNARNRNDI